MQIYKHSFPLDTMISPTSTTWDFYPYNMHPLTKLCFFDIETTGLSADTSNIYLIGAGYYENDSFNVIQWFADDYNSEKDILISFLNFLQPYEILFQYNGNSFDIPFIKNKCKRHKVNCSILNEIKPIDLYINLRKYADLLGLPNKKLKSFEQYIGLNRDDTFDGGQLIEVYAEYIQNQYLRKENEPLLKLLLLHNYEDITGLSQVASLMFLKELGKLNVTVNNIASDTENVTVTYSCNLPGDFNFEGDIGKTHCVWSRNEIVLTIPVLNTELCYFYNDYKDYYYMIEEDTVIHKSVAIYADASVRRKAKKSECFTKHYGAYIPVNKSGCFSQEMHIFRTEYTSKEHYIELTDELLNDKKFFEKYYMQSY